MGIDPTESFDAYTSDLIKAKAKKLLRHPAFRTEQACDIEQDLALQLLRARGKHDPKRSSFHTFADRVLTNHSNNMVEGRTAERRDPRRACSLDDESEQTRNDGTQSPEQIDVGIDFREAVKSLSEDLRPFVGLFNKAEAVELAKKHHLTRQKARTLRDRIERHFRDRGLGKYFDE